jgi:hypothetical protein
MRVGDLTLRLSLVPVPSMPALRAASEGRLQAAVLFGALLHAVILLLAFLGRAPAGDEERAAREVLARYQVSIDARAGGGGQRPRTNEVPSDEPETPQRGDATVPHASSAVPDRHGPEARSRSLPHERPETFGILALLADGARDSAGAVSAFARDDGPAAVGSIFGSLVDEASGSGGLGLSGIGESGGGLGAGVAFEPPVRRAATGFGAGHGRLGGGYATKSPSCRCGFTQVNGRLPPEAIQRVVRQSFGRLRGCYERGLFRDPGLEGRIATKFVIDREGAVAMVSVDERSLPDTEVAACVARAFEAMTFPKPTGGIVTVVYPVVFESTQE